MKQITHILISVALLLTGCTDEALLPETAADNAQAAENLVGTPVLFSSGNERLTPTRAAVPYMQQDGRFVCTMYYHTAAGATDSSPFDIRPAGIAGKPGTATTAWLKVNNPVGNSVYWNMNYDDVAPGNLDDLGFEKTATIFYWQNRLTHAFLALADYNKLTTNTGATDYSGTQGRLKLFPWGDKVLSSEDIPATDETVYTYDHAFNTYDLTRGSKEAITNQPDPIMALTIQKPEGSTQEANRVRLYFKHQFSQIQVNLRGAADESATISTDQIEKVELLGVSPEGYVANRLNTDGTVGDVPANSEPGTMNAASAKEVKPEDFTDEQLTANQWGTSFEMFDMAPTPLQDADGDGIDDRYALGYLKSYNAIAFGQLWGIRVTWRERSDDTPEAIANAIRHVSTFEVPLTNEIATDTPIDDPKPVVYLRNLQSGMKYIYNLELRRGTLAVIRTVILPWEQKEELVYGTDGTIVN